MRWARSRSEEVDLSRLRVNSAPFLSQVAHKFGREESDLCPNCELATKTSDHFLFLYPTWLNIRNEIFGPNPDYNVLQEQPTKVLDYLRRTGHLCPPNLGRESQQTTTTRNESNQKTEKTLAGHQACFSCIHCGRLAAADCLTENSKYQMNAHFSCLRTLISREL